MTDPTAEPSHYDKIRAALTETDSAWGDVTGDGDANPDYLDTLTESVVYLRDAEMEQLRAERDQYRKLWRDQTNALTTAARAERDEARAELAGLRERAVILPFDWRERFFTDVVRECDCESGTAARIKLMVESWRAPEPATPPKPQPCGDFIGDGMRCDQPKGHGGRHSNRNW